MIWNSWRSRRLRNVLRVFAAWAGGFAAALVLAQAPPAASSLPAPSSYVRFWNMLPQRDVTLELVSAATAPAVFASAASRNAHATYIRTPPGRYSFAIYRTGERDTALRTVSVALKPGAFLTILVAPPEQAGGPLRVEVIDDTSSPAGTGAEAGGRLTVRNFSVKAQSAQVIAQVKPPRTVTVGPAGSGTLDALPTDGIVGLSAEMTLSDGTHAGTGAEADFSKTRRATLLIFEDNYHRVRTRITLDGVPDLAADTSNGDSVPNPPPK